jgi:hypothetical protein
MRFIKNLMSEHHRNQKAKYAPMVTAALFHQILAKV